MEILSLVLVLLAVLLVPAIVLDVRARRRGSRRTIAGDTGDIHATHPSLPYPPPTEHGFDAGGIR